MIATSQQEPGLKHALFAARTLGLALDVVQSTATSPARPPRKLAQAAIAARLRELNLHLRMGLAALKQPQPGKAPASS